MSVATDSVEALQDAVRRGPRVLPHGGGSKPALSTPPPGDEEVVSVDVSGLTGILDYDPEELTFTARAGTPVGEVAEALAEHGQYLPWDPPLADAGATLGGVVAAGTSGPNAFRHGGVRDFIVGVRIIDGTGRLAAGGGKVVKNAAGFDLPKLMVGSMGRLGIIVELSFKIFPRPEATATVAVEMDSLEDALATTARLVRGPLDFDAIDLEPPRRLLLRLGGAPETLSARITRLQGELGRPGEVSKDAADAELWTRARELTWIPPDTRVVKVALTGRRIPTLEQALAATPATVRYSLGGNVAWVAWPDVEALTGLDAVLRAEGLAGLVLTGKPERGLLGRVSGGPFAERIRSALDPHARFLEA